MKPPVFEAAWPPEVVEIYRNDLREMWDSRVEPHSFHAYQNQLSIYADLARKYAGEAVLDVGCAQGTLALILGEDGKQVTAVDIRQPFLDYARTRYERGDVRFIAANIFDRPRLGTFDLIFANQIIEHLVYPANFLQVLSSYGKPGAVLVVTTPNHDYCRLSLPSYSELGDPKQHESRQFSAGGGDHFFAYTEAELRQAAKEAGLRVLEVFYFETPWISGHLLFRFLHRVVPLPLLKLGDRLALRMAPRRLAHQLCLVAQTPT
jgi:2-polyprenyl-3-methyl-5-hydroxy-6-metoxy-1,4-benzoquinol methylase